MKLNQEQRDARVQSARKHAIANWAGRTTAVSVSISQATADKFGLESGDGDGYLEQKTDTKGNKADGLEMVNGNCPQADSIEELEDLCELLKTDLLKLGNAKIRTEFQNAVRSHLNRDAESKKAMKQAQASEIQAKMASGELTAEQALAQIASLI
jgi:hypothetical protein